MMRLMRRLWLVPLLLTLGGATPSPEERLAATWRAHHPSHPDPPSCGEEDRVRTAFLDGKPVAASMRWGIAVLDGRAAWCELGCDTQYGGQVRSFESVRVRPGHADLALRTRASGHCGSVTGWTLFDAALTPLLTVDEEVDRACGASPEEHRRLPVTVEPGRVRAGDRVWRWDGTRFQSR